MSSVTSYNLVNCQMLGKTDQDVGVLLATVTSVRLAWWLVCAIQFWNVMYDSGSKSTMPMSQSQ